MRILFLHPEPQNIAGIVSRIGPFYPRRTAPNTRWEYVIRWGVRAGNDGVFTMNTRRGITNVHYRPTWTALLKLNNIPMCHNAHAKRCFHRVHRVHIVDLHIIAWQRLTSASNSVLHSPQHLTVAERIITRKALFASGLHFGAVDVCISPDGLPFIHAIHPNPPCSKRLFILYAKAMWNVFRQVHQDKTEHASQREQRLLLGADPEFLLVRRDNNSLRYASDYFPPGGTVGFDRQTINVQGAPKHVLAEIRPDAARNPKKLIANIQVALQKARRMAPDFNTKWLAGSYPHPGFPTGGHIHFSGVTPNLFLLRTLDNYLAVPTLLTEQPALAAKRRATYGMLSDMRLKSHGGFEYRTLGSWLSSYRRALVTLTLAYLTIVEYPGLRRNILQTLPSQQAFYKGDTHFFRQHVDRLWYDIEQTPSYEKWRQVLTVIRIWIHDRRYWQEETDLKRLWNIR